MGSEKEGRGYRLIEENVSEFPKIIQKPVVAKAIYLTVFQIQKLIQNIVLMAEVMIY